MARDRWIYQERETPEPWALHIWLFDDATIDFALYAEWLPAKSRKFIGRPATFESLTDALGTALDRAGHPLDVEDLKTLNAHWVRFAIDNNIL